MTLPDNAAKFLKKRLTSSITVSQKRWGKLCLKVRFTEDNDIFRNFPREGFITLLDELVTRKKLGQIKTKKLTLHWVYSTKVHRTNQRYSVYSINRKTGMQSALPELHRDCIWVDSNFLENPFQIIMFDDRPQHETDQFITEVEFLVK